MLTPPTHYDPPMHAVIYAARSKDEDAGKDSTGDQVALVQEKIADLGGRTIVGEPHTDHASGSKGNRGPGLEAAIHAAEEAAPCELWVHHTNRLGRGTGLPGEARALGKLLYDLMAAGVTVRSVANDEFATNEQLWGIASKESSQYSKDLGANVKRGKSSAFTKGRWPGGPVPDGYRLSARDPQTDARTLEEDPQRAPIIRRMFELRLEGLAFADIARRVNGEGHRTRPQPARGIIEGLPFTPVRVRSALSNPVYAGRAVLKGQEGTVPGAWPAIVDPGTFDLVGIKAVQRKGETKMGRPPTEFALGSLAVCDKCGRPMVGRKDPYARKDGTRRRSYVCASVKSRTGTCDAPRVDAHRVDQAVAAQLETLFIDMEAWKREIAQNAANQRGGLEAELGLRRKELLRVQRQRDTARERYLEKQTAAREDALEHVLGLAKAAQERVDDAEAALAAVSDEPPIDAMLDASNALKRALDEPGSINERLRRVFKEFRIGTSDETIIVLPVLLPDVVKAHGGRSDRLTIIDGDASTVVSHGGDASDSPVMLVVPPAKALHVDLKLTNAWA
jgi:DNA invertase Pin-like site-specific DNA recombinase